MKKIIVALILVLSWPIVNASEFSLAFTPGFSSKSELPLGGLSRQEDIVSYDNIFEYCDWVGDAYSTYIKYPYRHKQWIPPISSMDALSAAAVLQNADRFMPLDLFSRGTTAGIILNNDYAKLLKLNRTPETAYAYFLMGVSMHSSEVRAQCMAWQYQRLING